MSRQWNFRSSPALLALCIPLGVFGCGDSAESEDRSPANPSSTTAQGADAEMPQDNGCAMPTREVPNEGSQHVEENTELSFESNPPASGNHYPVWTRFEKFDLVKRGYWVHNLEHGGVALLYGPDASPDLVDALGAVFDALPTDPDCDAGNTRVLMTFDPELDDAIAVAAWNVVMEADCVNPALVVDFVNEHRGKAPENICTDGSYLPPT